MTTITLEINEKTKKGKALLAFLKAFYEDQEVVQIVEEPKSPYNKAFVAKIQKARKEKGREILPNEDLWEAIK
jgi:N-acetyl-gamma-glutamylphosphate reductase